ncbi:MAG: glycoside hydrolase family 31 protein [Lachnospiraceae bacterium]|nr:glycoside hydrolase family 31 protein [Lachnospiraceae bacterium]
MVFEKKGNALIGREKNETLCIEPWGKDSLRVRSTVLPEFSGLDRALTEDIDKGSADIKLAEKEGGLWSGSITNGRIRAEVNPSGIVAFFKDDERVLYEYNRNYGVPLTKETRCLKAEAREFTGSASGSFKLTARFERNEGERIYGCGQYQHPYLNLKGCSLELAQKNSQVSIPFALSSLGYGFLWNNPATGRVTFGKNLTEWAADESNELDYWITVADKPAEILEKYTAAVGRAPVLGPEYLGFWQCKLRYRTPEEVLSVARRYNEMGIQLDVIVIDFFHWPYQGSWRFDEKYWPEDKVKAMCDELHSMGIKVMVSIWPSVDKRSENYEEMLMKGYFVRNERGGIETYDYQGECATIDVFNPGAREYLWSKCRENYKRLGIDLFWFDNAEPDSIIYHYDNMRYYTGRASMVANEYPKYYLRTVSEGFMGDGDGMRPSLIRSAWAGSQKYGAVLWSGDVPSTFEAFRDQISAGLNAGLAGIPWWNSDIGGFMTDDVNDPEFQELLLRWFGFGVFCPIMRLHGDRGPYDIPPLDTRDFGAGYLHTGQPNEIWSYGEENEAIMKKFVELRLSMRDYIAGLMKEAHENGSPVIRTMFYEFPEDEACWECEDQYMFGPDYLVAPVYTCGARERELYLPAGKWENIFTKEVTEGGKRVCVSAPLDQIPAFKRL